MRKPLAPMPYPQSRVWQIKNVNVNKYSNIFVSKLDTLQTNEYLENDQRNSRGTLRQKETGSHRYHGSYFQIRKN